MAASATYSTLDEWIAREAMAFSLESAERFDAAVDAAMSAMGESVVLVGLGEPMHGGEAFLVLRNRLFQRLVERHGFTAIAIESSFPRGRLVNEFVHGRGAAAYDEVRDAGFSHAFGKLETTRELIDWMREYNLASLERAKLRFYGFDSPTEMMYSDSPRGLICVAVDYLSSVDAACGKAFRSRVEAHIGDDADWENPSANMDPTKAIGATPAAAALRLVVEELVTELRVRRPELIAANGDDEYMEALHHATSARQFLTYHAIIADSSETRLEKALGVRDLMMAHNLAYIVEREQRRGGRVLAFAHNSHLKLRSAEWQLGPQLLRWWPAGAHMRARIGSRYAVIGTGVGVSAENGISEPEARTIEARLMASPGPGRFIATRLGAGLPAAEVAALPTRSGSLKNFGYFPLSSQSLSDFDWLCLLDSTGYSRGGPVLP